MKMIFDPQANINSFSQECFYTCPWFNSDSFGTEMAYSHDFSSADTPPTLLLRTAAYFSFSFELNLERFIYLLIFMPYHFNYHI